MTALQELQNRLEGLPLSEREAIARRLLDEWDTEQWDDQIEADAAAGKLDHLINQAKAHHQAGRTTPI